MRKIALTARGGVVALNGFLGHAGQHFAEMMNLRLQYYGATVPAVTVLALALYVVGGVALLLLGLGIPAQWPMEWPAGIHVVFASFRRRSPVVIPA